MTALGCGCFYVTLSSQTVTSAELWTTNTPLAQGTGHALDAWLEGSPASTSKALPVLEPVTHPTTRVPTTAIARAANFVTAHTWDHTQSVSFQSLY